MGISENFLVNTRSFDPIIKALVSRAEHPEQITEATLENMGYDNPSDLLVLHVLRGLDIINQDKTPTDLYIKMVDPQHTKNAIAEGVINGYGELFERKPNIHMMLSEDIQEELRAYFEGKKTDLIIKYIANTFQKLVSFAGTKKVEKARDHFFNATNGQADTEAKEAEHINNGNSAPDIKDSITQESVKSRSVEEILFGDTKGEEDREPDEREPPADSEPESPPVEDEEEPEEIETDIEQDGRDEKFFDTEDKKDDIEAEDTPEAVPEPPKKKPENKKEHLSPASLNTSNERVRKAIIKRAELQYQLEYFEDALESSEEIIAYFDDADEELLKEAVKNAVIRRVDLLNKLEAGSDKLIPTLNEVINRFSDSESATYYGYASRAMLQKAELLEKSDYDKKSLLPLYNVIIERLREETDPVIQQKVTHIYAKRLELLAHADDRSGLLKALNESIQRFKQSENYRKYLEEAMFRKAELLELMERDEEALEAYISFLEEFGTTIET